MFVGKENSKSIVDIRVTKVKELYMITSYVSSCKYYRRNSSFQEKEDNEKRESMKC